MSHARNAVRLAIVVFWLTMVGLAYTAFHNSGNALSLSWATWMFYAVIAVVVIYVGAVLTHKFWSLK